MSPESEISLRYGINPHQTPAKAFRKYGPMPFTVLNGAPGYINLLDALNSWQLVKELDASTGLASAASFKHVSPAGAAVALPISDVLKKVYNVEHAVLSDVALAYARARGADRLSSFGDWVAISRNVDVTLAQVLAREVSDGIIAPSFSPEALEVLKKKQDGRYIILQVDLTYVPGGIETRDVFGVTLEQVRNTKIAGKDQLANIVTKSKEMPPSAQRDLIVALTTLKYTQSNSMCLALDGQVIGVGAGQQSRIHCTRLAASKADTWHLRQHPKVLDLQFRKGLSRPEKDNAIDGFIRDDLSPAELKVWEESFEVIPTRLTPQEKRQWLDGLKGVSMASDAFIPFRDNIDRAVMSGVKYIVHPGGSVRDAEIVAACDQYGITLAVSGVRLFHH